MLKNGTVVTKVVKAEVRISVFVKHSFKMIKDLNTPGTGCCDIATKIKEVELNRFPCYNANVTASDTGDRKEVYHHGTSDIFFNRCHGWCSLPLHQQMAGQAISNGNQPADA